MLDWRETKGNSVQLNVFQSPSPHRKGLSEVPELGIKTHSGNVSFVRQCNPITAATTVFIKIVSCYLQNGVFYPSFTALSWNDYVLYLAIKFHKVACGINP